MCGRYCALSDEENEEIMDIIREVEQNLSGSPELEKLKTGEIFPTNVAPILTSDGPKAMKWGFAKWDGKGVVINSRSEGLLESKMFRKPALESRCLVPASHYFEWEGEGKSKVKQRIKVPGKKMMYMAGIYRREQGEPHPVFSIITREASPQIRHIHDRMPVILDEAAAKQWLTPGVDVEDVLRTAVQGVAFEPEAPIAKQEQIRFF